MFMSPFAKALEPFCSLFALFATMKCKEKIFVFILVEKSRILSGRVSRSQELMLSTE